MAQTEQHTPGPWSADFTDVPYLEIGEGWVVDAPSGSVCTIDSPAAEREANARLIAAAPDLLEELEQQADGTATIISLLGGQSSAVAASLVGMLRIQEQAARAAIAKATGASS